MSNTLNNQDTITMIENFAQDFEIEYKTWNYDQKKSVVKYRVDTSSNSEISGYTITVPAFIIRRYSDLKGQQKKG